MPKQITRLVLPSPGVLLRGEATQQGGKPVGHGVSFRENWWTSVLLREQLKGMEIPVKHFPFSPWSLCRMYPEYTVQSLHKECICVEKRRQACVWVRRPLCWSRRGGEAHSAPYTRFSSSGEVRTGVGRHLVAKGCTVRPILFIPYLPVGPLQDMHT